MHQRKHGAGHDRYIRAPNQFQQSQGVGYLFVAPLVPADNRNPQYFHYRRLNQGQQRLHIANAGPRTILVDDDLPALRGESGPLAISRRKTTKHSFRFLITDLGWCVVFSLESSANAIELALKRKNAFVLEKTTGRSRKKTTGRFDSRQRRLHRTMRFFRRRTVPRVSITTNVLADGVSGRLDPAHGFSRSDLRRGQYAWNSTFVRVILRSVGGPQT